MFPEVSGGKNTRGKCGGRETPLLSLPSLPHPRPQRERRGGEGSGGKERGGGREGKGGRREGREGGGKVGREEGR